MTPVDQIINSLRVEPEKWHQTEYTLNHEKGIEIWTTNMPYFDIGIYSPKRKISFFDKIRLQRAVNQWHKLPLVTE